MDWSDSHKAVLQMRQIMQAYEKHSPLEGVLDSTSSYNTRDGVQNRMLVFRPATNRVSFVQGVENGNNSFSSGQLSQDKSPLLAATRGPRVFAIMLEGDSFQFLYPVHLRVS